VSHLSAFALIQVKYALMMTIILCINDVISFLGSIFIFVTEPIVVNISTYVNLFFTEVILLIIDRVVEPKLMDNHICLPARFTRRILTIF